MDGYRSSAVDLQSCNVCDMMIGSWYVMLLFTFLSPLARYAHLRWCQATGCEWSHEWIQETPFYTSLNSNLSADTGSLESGPLQSVHTHTTIRLQTHPRQFCDVLEVCVCVCVSPALMQNNGWLVQQCDRLTSHHQWHQLSPAPPPPCAYHRCPTDAHASPAQNENTHWLEWKFEHIVYCEKCLFVANLP